MRLLDEKFLRNVNFVIICNHQNTSNFTNFSYIFYFLILHFFTIFKVLGCLLFKIEEDALRSIYAFQYIITACQRFDGKDLAQHIVASKELYNRLVLSQIQFIHEKEFVFYSKSVVEKYRF